MALPHVFLSTNFIHKQGFASDRKAGGGTKGDSDRMRGRPFLRKTVGEERPKKGRSGGPYDPSSAAELSKAERRGF